MNPYRTYKEATTTESTRIDMLLSLFDRAIERLEAALTALREKQISTATKLLLRVQLLVRGLSAGVDPKYKEAENFLRLYEFVNHSIAQRTTEHTEAALKVLHTLRDGFRAIRPEAVALERSGAIPPLSSSQGVRAMA